MKNAVYPDNVIRAIHFRATSIPGLLSGKSLSHLRAQVHFQSRAPEGAEPDGNSRRAAPANALFTTRGLELFNSGHSVLSLMLPPPYRLAARRRKGKVGVCL